MPRIRNFAAVALSFVLALPAQGQEAFFWVYNAHYPMDPEAVSLDLVATDASAVALASEGSVPRGVIWVRCVQERAGSMAALRFEASTGAAQAGEVVNFELVDGTGAVFQREAVIFDAEFDPVGGPEITVPLDAPELAALAGSDFVSYGVVGIGATAQFDVSGNRGYVQQFLNDCAALSGGGGGAPVLPPETTIVGGGPAVTIPVLPFNGSVPGAGGGEIAPPEFGPATTGHIWGRFTALEADPTQSTVTAFYGVPETDDVLIQAACSLTGSGPVVQMQVTADPGGRQNGEPMLIRFGLEDGRSADVQAVAFGVGAEFGISGASMVMTVDDPAWLVIAGGDRLLVESVDTGTQYRVSGNGPNTLGPFLADCAIIQSLDPGGPSAPAAPIAAQPGFLSCDNLGRVLSNDSGATFEMDFINGTNGSRNLVWIDQNGTQSPQATLAPGEAARFTTDSSHIWMATDGAGMCMEMIQPVPSQTGYVFSVQAP